MLSRICDFLYFSYSTLTTTGYGDMVPLHPLAKMMTSIEGVVGAIYVAVMIARLVGIHISQGEPHRHRG